MSAPEPAVGVACGECGAGPVYMETCPIDGHDCVIASECQHCGLRYDIPSGCLDCGSGTP